MEVIYQVGRDHPVDLKRVMPGSVGSGNYEHLLTLVPVEFRGSTARFCFVGRSDVTILRDGVRNPHPPQSAVSPAWPFLNLVLKLKTGDVIRVGLGLIDFKLLSVDRGRATIKATMLVDGLMLITEPLSGSQELSVRDMIDRMNRGEDYRTGGLPSA
jgi:hypothetical protein